MSAASMVTCPGPHGGLSGLGALWVLYFVLMPAVLGGFVALVANVVLLLRRDRARSPWVWGAAVVSLASGAVLVGIGWAAFEPHRWQVGVSFAAPGLLVAGSGVASFWRNRQRRS